MVVVVVVVVVVVYVRMCYVNKYMYTCVGARMVWNSCVSVYS